MPARDEPDLDPVLADAVRRAVVRPVDGVTASRHIDAIVAAAQGDAPSLAVRRTRRRLWRPLLGGGVAVTLLLPVGLAVAGVSLPAAVQRPYSAVGIELPNQAPDRPLPAPAAPGPRPAAPARAVTTPQAGGAQSADNRRSKQDPNGRAPARRHGVTGGAAAPPAGSASSHATSNGNGAAHGSGAAKGNGAAKANRAKASPKPVRRRPSTAPKNPAASKPTPSKPAASKPSTSQGAGGRRPSKPAPHATRPSPAQGAPASQGAGAAKPGRP
jgi:translation initiation factor IF-2